MARVVVISWDHDVEARAGALRRAGHDVQVVAPEGTPGLRPLRDAPPDVVVVDLERRPSEGRAVGVELRRLAATRRVPLVFAGGEREKVTRVRELLPDAGFAAWEEIAAAAAAARPPAEPAVPGAMDAYSGTPLSKKLGIRAGTPVALLDAPDGFEARLAPGRVESDVGEIAILFVSSSAQLEQRLPAALDAFVERGSLWIAWPKRASGLPSDLSQAAVRRIGMAAGLVDFKVAALDETWSGLRFARRA